eukprot:517744-Rhodomonas_salina.3
MALQARIGTSAQRVLRTQEASTIPPRQYQRAYGATGTRASSLPGSHTAYRRSHSARVGPYLFSAAEFFTFQCTRYPNHAITNAKLVAAQYGVRQYRRSRSRPVGR